MSGASGTLGNRLSIESVAESDKRTVPMVSPFQGAEYCFDFTWGFAEAAAPQALMFVAVGDEEHQAYGKTRRSS